MKVEGGQYGHHNHSDHHRHTVAYRRRLVRPRTVVLGSDFAAAAATFTRKSYALAEVGYVFLVEDIERRQADVGDFFLIKSNDRTQCGVLQRRYIRCRRICGCAARHHQRHPGGSPRLDLWTVPIFVSVLALYPSPCCGVALAAGP